MGRYDSASLDRLADDFKQDGFVVLKRHFDPQRIAAWAEAFKPLLHEAINDPALTGERGKQRFYVTLPFEGIFADPHFFDDDDIVSLVERVVGENPVMCQLATDTPLKDSEHQSIHRDTPALFPEWDDKEVPPYQLAVNFPLCPVTLDNGPLEMTRGTHTMTRTAAMEAVESGQTRLEPLTMDLGDVIVRDVRVLHRGTPNTTDEPRPMVVIGYSRHWYFRPEVHVDIPRATWDSLSKRAKGLLRNNPVVESLAHIEKGERYQAFAY